MKQFHFVAERKETRDAFNQTKLSCDLLNVVPVGVHKIPGTGKLFWACQFRKLNVFTILHFPGLTLDWARTFYTVSSRYPVENENNF